MTGPKTNEGATKVGERTGTRAVSRYVRASAYKAREVLNLIRGLEVAEADGVLQFVERDIAIVIRKRTCHITVLVARLPEAELEKRRRLEEAKPASARARRGAANAAAARRERVARSRQAAAAAKGETHDHDHDHDHEHEHEAQPFVAGDVDLHPYGEGSHAALADTDEAPEGFDIKGNADSMLYHVPGSRFYKATKAEVWFASEEAAEAGGFQKPASQRVTDTAVGDDAAADDTAADDTATDDTVTDDGANDTEEDA